MQKIWLSTAHKFNWVVDMGQYPQKWKSHCWSNITSTRNLTEYTLNDGKKREDIWYDDKSYTNVCTEIDRKKKETKLNRTTVIKNENQKTVFKISISW